VPIELNVHKSEPAKLERLDRGLFRATFHTDPPASEAETAMVVTVVFRADDWHRAHEFVLGVMGFDVKERTNAAGDFVELRG